MTPFANVSRADIDAGLARGRQLRSRYFADRAAALSGELTRALIRRLRGRDITRHLDDLPDYLLKDIGIERHQIPALAAGALRRQESSLALAARRRIAAAFQRRPQTVEVANDDRHLAA